MMTVILGYLDDRRGQCWLAGDGFETSGGRILRTDCKKIARLGHWLVGVAGDTHALPLLLRKGRHIGEMTDIYEIGDAISAMFSEARYAADDDKGSDAHGPPCYKQQMLFARLGELWQLTSNHTPITPRYGLAAIGCGAPEALAAGFALLPFMAQDPDDFVHRAVSIAIEMDTDCGGDIQVERVLC